MNGPALKALKAQAFLCALALHATVIAQAWADAAEHGAHDEHALDWTMVGAAFVNFFVLLSVLIFVLRKPLKEFLVSRKAAIESALKSAAEVKAEAEAQLAQYRERLANMDQELSRLKAEMLQAGQAERERMLYEAEQKVERMRKDVTFTIEQQVKQVRLDLLNDLANKTVSTAEQVLVKEVSASDRDRLSKSFLDMLKQIAEQPVNPSRRPSYHGGGSMMAAPHSRPPRSARLSQQALFSVEQLQAKDKDKGSWPTS